MCRRPLLTVMGSKAVSLLNAATLSHMAGSPKVALSERMTMKRKQPASKSKVKNRGGRKLKGPLRPGSVIEKVLALIRASPGIRPSEVNRSLRLKQSDAQRASLIKRGLIRKEKEGSVVRYYAV
jgi:hypothetical protein